MRILTKFTLKSMMENKFRTFLILLSISLSVALSLASFAMRDVIKNSIIQNVKQYYGTANVMIHANEDSPSPLLRIKPLQQASPLVQYQIGSTQTSGLLMGVDDGKDLPLSLAGYTLDDAAKLAFLNVKQTLNEPFSGKVIYLSEFTAEQYDISLGQYIEVLINGYKHKLKVSGIAYNSGVVSSSADSHNAMMPSSTLMKLLGNQDRYYQVLYQTCDDVSVDRAIEALALDYPRYEVRETVPWQMIDSQLNMIIVPFIFMLMLVLATAVFIIYTAFKVITTEKLPVLGTFRSIGATKRTVDYILILEAIGYGIVGGLIGIAMGFGLLYLIASFIINSLGAPGQISDVVSVNTSYYLLALLFGTILAVVSSLMPILRVSKLSVRDIVLGFSQSFKERSKLRMLLSSATIVVAMIVPYVAPLNQSTAVDLIAMVMLCAGLLLVVPYLIKIFIYPLRVIAKVLFGNLGRISVQNIEDNKSITNNIALLTIGIASIMLINVLSGTITEEVIKVFNAADFNVAFTADNIERQDVMRIKNVKGVSDVLAVGGPNNVTVVDRDINLYKIEIAEGMRYFDYWRYDLEGERAAISHALTNSRAIVITRTIKEQLDLEIGDALPLKFQNDKVANYKIVGIMDGINYNGYFAVASPSYIRTDSGQSNIPEIYIKTEYPDYVADQLEEIFKHRDFVSVMTMAEMRQQNDQSNAMIIGIFGSFSFIAMAIGTIGILNNFIVSLMARQRSIAVMKSVGMSKWQTFKMLAIEALMSGLIGGITGLFGGVMLTLQVNQFLKLVGFPFDAHITADVVALGLVLGVVISLVSTIMPARNVARMNIVTAIKYE